MKLIFVITLLGNRYGIYIIWIETAMGMYIRDKVDEDIFIYR